MPDELTRNERLPPDGMYGCEVGGTITTGVRMYCIHCEEWFSEWSSLDKFPRLQEMVEVWGMHTVSRSHLVRIGVVK
jgi:hypothetical protein